MAEICKEGWKEGQHADMMSFIGLILLWYRWTENHSTVYDLLHGWWDDRHECPLSCCVFHGHSGSVDSRPTMMDHEFTIRPIAANI